MNVIGAAVDMLRQEAWLVRSLLGSGTSHLLQGLQCISELNDNLLLGNVDCIIIMLTSLCLCWEIFIDLWE